MGRVIKHPVYISSRKSEISTIPGIINMFFFLIEQKISNGVYALLSFVFYWSFFWDLYRVIWIFELGTVELFFNENTIQNRDYIDIFFKWKILLLWRFGMGSDISIIILVLLPLFEILLNGGSTNRRSNRRRKH